MSLESGGQPVTGVANQRKRLALLALLAVAGDLGVARDRILALLWPESDIRARNTLNQFMHVLRRELGDVVISTTRDLKLNPDMIATDVGEFRASIARSDYGRAAELYRGPFLDGLFLRETSDFERWMEMERADLASAYGEVLERLATMAAASGDLSACVGWWRMRAGVDRLSARVGLSYMKALVAAGDREAAIQHARVFGALVRSELDAAPDPDIERYARALATRDVMRNPSGPDASAIVTASQVAEVESGPTPMPPSRTASIASPILSRWGFREGMIAAVLLVVVLVAATSFADRPRSRSDLVIVTPFENQSGDSSLNMLGLVIANSLTQGLAGTGRLSVGDFQTVLKTMARPLVGKQSELDRAADGIRQSGAGWVVRGSIHRRGDSLVVDARIVRPDGGIVSALAPIVPPRSEESLLLERARQTVVGAMAALHDATVESWGQAPATLPQYSAQQEYTLGLDAMTRADVERAQQHFRHAVELDPQFAAPRFELLWSRDALSDSMLRALDSVRDKLSLPEQMDLEIFNGMLHNDLEAAYQWAERRVALTPDDPAALLMLESQAYNTNRYGRAVTALHAVRRFPPWHAGSYVLDINAHHMAGDFPTALREAMEGRTRSPRNWLYCSKVMEQYAALGYVREADSVLTSCEGVPDVGDDPGWPYYIMGQELLAHGHAVEAGRVFGHCIGLRLDYAARHPDGRGGRAWLASQCLFARGDWARAYPVLRTDFTHYPNIDKGHMELGIAAAHLGDTATATAMLRWHEGRSRTDSDHLWYRAGILVALDRRDDAIQLLREAVKGTSPAIMAHINNVRAFLPLAGDSRFEMLVAARRDP